MATDEVANVRPSVTIVTPVSDSAFAETAGVDVVAMFDEGPVNGPHTCDVSWGDGSTTVGMVTGHTCAASHPFAPGAAGQRQIVGAVTDLGGTRGAAAVTVAITAALGSACHDPRVRCAAAGVGLLGPARAIAFECTAWSTRGRTGGQLALLDGRFRLVASIVQSLDIVGRAAVIRGTGAVNGRPGYTYETYADDRPAARDTLRVVVRDRTGLVVKDVGGEVTRGDLAASIVR